MTHALACDQANSQCGSVAITYKNYTQYSVEMNPPVSFVFELVSDDRLASTAGAKNSSSDDWGSLVATAK